MNNNLNNYVEWLKDQNISERTIEIYTQSLLKFTNNFTTDAIRNYLKECLLKYEVSTVKIYRQALSSYVRYKKLDLDWAKINGVLPKVQGKFFTTLSQQELLLLKKTKNERFLINYQRNNLIIDFLLYTGIRVKELVNIKHSDYQNKQLRILGKGNKVRYIFSPPFLEKCFDLSKQDYLFTNLDGSKMLTKHIQRIIRLRTLKAGLNKLITPHSFRRSFATLLNNRKVNLTTIQKLLGHNNINTTASYIHNDYQTLYADYSKLWKNEPKITNQEF